MSNVIIEKCANQYAKVPYRPLSAGYDFLAEDEQ